MTSTYVVPRGRYSTVNNFTTTVNPSCGGKLLENRVRSFLQCVRTLKGGVSLVVNVEGYVPSQSDGRIQGY